MPQYADIPKFKIPEAAIREVGQVNMKARHKIAKELERKRLSNKERQSLIRADENLEILQTFVQRSLHHLYDAFDK